VAHNLELVDSGRPWHRYPTSCPEAAAAGRARESAGCRPQVLLASTSRCRPRRQGARPASGTSMPPDPDSRSGSRRCSSRTTRGGARRRRPDRRHGVGPARYRWHSSRDLQPFPGRRCRPTSSVRPNALDGHAKDGVGTCWDRPCPCSRARRRSRHGAVGPESITLHARAQRWARSSHRVMGATSRVTVGWEDGKLVLVQLASSRRRPGPGASGSPSSSRASLPSPDRSSRLAVPESGRRAPPGATCAGSAGSSPLRDTPSANSDHQRLPHHNSQIPCRREREVNSGCPRRPSNLVRDSSTDEACGEARASATLTPAPAERLPGLLVDQCRQGSHRAGLPPFCSLETRWICRWASRLIHKECPAAQGGLGHHLGSVRDARSDARFGPPSAAKRPDRPATERS